MKVFQIWLQLTTLLYGANALIIPDQLVSLLTLVYSTIPPVEKGTDSRFGIGFRLGPFADLQVLLELGPQRYTQPIGVVGSSINPEKRYTLPLDPIELQRLEKAHTDREARSRTSFENTNSIASDPVSERSKAWLSRWRSSLVMPLTPVASMPAVAPLDPMASEAPSAPSAPAAPIQKMLPVQRTLATVGYTENSRPPSTTGYGEQSQPVRNYPKLQRLRQLYTMAVNGG